MSEVYYTRTKNGRTPPRAKDNIAWKHNGLPEPEFVLRSPEHPERWLNQLERDQLMQQLSHEDTPFTSRKGQRPLVNPSPGQFAWFRPKNPRKKSRDRYEYRGGGTWQFSPPRVTDEL